MSRSCHNAVSQLQETGGIGVQENVPWRANRVKEGSSFSFGARADFPITCVSLWEWICKAAQCKKNEVVLDSTRIQGEEKGSSRYKTNFLVV